MLIFFFSFISQDGMRPMSQANNGNPIPYIANSDTRRAARVSARLSPKIKISGLSSAPRRSGAAVETARNVVYAQHILDICLLVSIELYVQRVDLGCSGLDFLLLDVARSLLIAAELILI